MGEERTSQAFGHRQPNPGENDRPLTAREWSIEMRATDVEGRRAFPMLSGREAKALWHSGYRSVSAVARASDAELLVDVHDIFQHAHCRRRTLAIIRAKIPRSSAGSSTVEDAH